MLIKRIMVFVAIFALLFFAVGCPDDDNGDDVRPEVTITTPEDVAVFITTTVISFIGSAMDEIDSILTGSSLSWTSSLSGIIGTGESFSRTLPEGSHTITLAATNSAGNTGTSAISIIVEAVPNPTGTELYHDYVYNTVKIGEQWWFAENLQTTRYSDGTAIPYIEENHPWNIATSGAYCEYFDDDNPDIGSNVDTYGRLYNWYAASDARGLCPSGWRVPTEEDWKTLEIYLGISAMDAADVDFRGTNQGSRLAGGYGNWQAGELKNNSAFGTSGFNALPGGSRAYMGEFGRINSSAVFWQSSDYTSLHSWYRALGNDNAGIYRAYGNKQYGYSIRCVRSD